MKLKMHQFLRHAVLGGALGIVFATTGAQAQSASSSPQAAPAVVQDVADYSKRPAARVITSAPRSLAWVQRAMHGIADPKPDGLRFLKDQGAWFNPFLIAGMPSYYDIRGWHPADKPTGDYLRAVYSPLHFKPAIEQAKDSECLACHQEVIDARPKTASQAGIRAERSMAWYQHLSTYAGEQDTFHRRHLTSDYAKQVMDLKCNTCHQGHDPRDEAPNSSASASKGGDFTLRKQVNPETTCLKCHGQMNWQVMGLPGPWQESKATFQENCLLCHAGIRTNRHQVNYLKAEAIEAAGAKNADVCFGCHGGRSWYRISYPYPRHAWPGMDKTVPDWAKNRPTQSEPRFLKNAPGAEVKAVTVSPVKTVVVR